MENHSNQRSLGQSVAQPSTCDEPNAPISMAEVDCNMREGDGSNPTVDPGLGRVGPMYPQVLTGKKNLLPFDFLRKGDRLGRAVVKIELANGAVGTGFLVAPDILLTNHHVLPDPAVAATSIVTANFEAKPADDETGRMSVVRMRPAELFVSNVELDFSFCAIRGLEYLGSIPLSRNGLLVNITDYVNIIQHPRGGPKQVAVQDNTVVHADDILIRYSCDTEPGSSGSPVFNNDWQLVALHHGWVPLNAPGEGAPMPGPATPLQYLNEGIRLSAIALWLDAESVNRAARTDQIARVRGLFRGTDPRLGLFGALGRVNSLMGAASFVADCYQNASNSLDIGYWKLVSSSNTSEELAALARLVADSRLDLWCLAGLDPSSARTLCLILAVRFGLEYEMHVVPPHSALASRRGLTILRHRSRHWVIEIEDKLYTWGSEPTRLWIRSDEDSEFALQLVLCSTNSATARQTGAGWQVPGQGADCPKVRPERWAACLETNRPGASNLHIETILLGPDVPSSPQGLYTLRRRGWAARVVSVGPSGSCVLLNRQPTRIERVFLSANLVPVLGDDHDVMAAADREFSSSDRTVNTHEPMALRIVLREP